MQRGVFALLLVVLCAAGSARAWEDVGFGVAYKQFGGGGRNVFLGYAGFSGKLVHTKTWVTALHTARLAGLSFDKVYAIQGPRESDYRSYEIGNTALVAHLLGHVAAGDTVWVAAHSSGGFVAHEFFNIAFKQDAGHKLAGMSFFNLDGDWAGVANHLTRFSKIYGVGVWTANNVPASTYASQMKNNVPGSADQKVAVELDGTNSGCNAGAAWCFHDVVINERPYNPAHYDLDRDYGSINAEHPVQTGWIPAAQGGTGGGHVGGHTGQQAVINP